MTITIDLQRRPRISPGRPGRLRRMVGAVRRSAVSAVAAAITPAKPVIRKAAEIPLTLAGFGCIDAAFYRWALIPGLLVTGVTLILVEHMLATE